MTQDTATDTHHISHNPSQAKLDHSGGCSDSKSRSLLDVTRRVWWSSVWGVVGVLSFELLTLTSSVEASSDLPWGGSAIHIISLYALMMPIYAVVCSLILPPLIEALPRPRHWFGLDLSATERKRYLSRSISLALSLLIIVGLVFTATLISRSFNRATLAAAWVSIFSVIGMSVAAVLMPACLRFVSWTIERISPQVRIGPIPLSLIPSLVVFTSFVGVLFWLSGLDLGAHQLDGYILLGTIPLLTITFYVACVWWASRLQERGAQRSVSAQRWLVSVALVIGVCVAGAMWGLSAWDTSHPSNQLIPQQAQLSSLLLNGARSLTDRDGDGVSAILGGGDCDDQNPLISPLAREIPDNGLDDNCADGDASTPEPVAPPPEPPEHIGSAEKTQWNVIVLLIDTLRADHLPIYGYDRPTMPNLTQFAKDAVIFDRAFAHAPRTPFSIPSALIGRYPSRISWVKRFTNYSVLKDENETIFERFKSSGWRTEAVSAHWYFGTKKAVNLNQGLDQWDNRGELSVSKSNTQSEAAGITRRLIERMHSLSEAQKKAQLAPSGEGQIAQAEGATPFLLFAHYFAPHGRYMSHRVKCRQSKKWCHREPRCAEHPTQCVFGDPKARGAEKLINKYDSELAYTDLYLGDVFKAYRELGLDENTVVVVISDHGESFKDRKPAYLFHGRSVYNEELHIPLMIRTPKSKPQRRSEIVGLVDVSPTLSELTHTARGQVDGMSLAPLLGSDSNESPTQRERILSFTERTLFLEQLPYPGHKVHMVAAISGNGLKIIRNITKQTWRMFDLVQDWGERKNFWRKPPSDRAQEIKRLRSHLARFIELTP